MSTTHIPSIPAGRLLGAGRPAGLRAVPARVLARHLARALGVIVLALAAIVASEMVAIQRSGTAGERALARAESLMRDGRFAEARRAVVSARERFDGVSTHARVLQSVTDPLPGGDPVADQARAARTLASAGSLAAGATLQIVDAAVAARGPAEAGMLAALRRLRHAMTGAGAKLDRATARLATLRGAALAGPLREVAGTARRRVRHARRTLASGVQALGAAIVLAGGEGPRRYLVLAQNPAEPRPTGGFIGSYGVLTARDGHIALERYSSIESWYRAHRRAVVPAASAPRAMRLPSPPVPQTIANVNATPDWPSAARLAARLWRRGGEAPVDGVISVTPDLVARALAVIGPVRAAGFDRTVTSKNVVAALDDVTHRSPEARTTHRKRFVSRLAHEIMRRLRARSMRLPALGQALLRGLDAGEVLVWSRDGVVQRTAVARGWDGTLPRTRGDYFFDSEFSYPAKNGREIRRRFEHDVTLRADGSARVATTITIRNSNRLGYPYASYTTLYGPAGAHLAPDSDPPIAAEAPVAGHPAAGWLLRAVAWGTTRVRVVWDVPDLLTRRADGTLVYRLRWTRVPLHGGDDLRLRVTPPPGWRWARHGPPARSRLPRDLRDAWSLVRIAPR